MQLNGHQEAAQTLPHVIFFLWGYVEDRVFKTTPPSLINLRQRIEEVFQELKENGEIIRKTFRSMVDRSNTCLERNGGHVEGY